MEAGQWLDIGTDHAAFMAAKRERLEGRPPLYYRSLASSRPAQSELLELAVANLLAHHAQHFSLEGRRLIDCEDGSRHELDASGREPLEIASRILEEDFVLFERQGGRDIVIAASNAYTSSGRIVSCVGRDMHFAHEPVPGLNEQLGARIDRVIANVQPGKPVVRFNWFITPIASRLFPETSHAGNAEAAERAAERLRADHRLAGEMLWMRVERQTFLRLPRSGALAFGIHTYSDPLSSLAGDGESLAAIRRLLGAYSEERLRYASMLPTREPVLRWIEERLA